MHVNTVFPFFIDRYIYTFSVIAISKLLYTNFSFIIASYSYCYTMEQATHAVEVINKDYSNKYNIMMPIVHVGYNFPIN